MHINLRIDGAIYTVWVVYVILERKFVTGPLPHNVTKSEISAADLIGTGGFEFVEFSQPDPEVRRDLFTTMDYLHTAIHKKKEIGLRQKGDITYFLNAQTDGFAAKFAAEYRCCAASMVWRVADAQHVFDHALKLGAKPF